jgi:hypothetical protein
MSLDTKKKVQFDGIPENYIDDRRVKITIEYMEETNDEKIEIISNYRLSRKYSIHNIETLCRIFKDISRLYQQNTPGVF